MVEIHTVMLARYKSDKIGNNPAMLGYWAAGLLERQCGAMWATERKGLEQPVLRNFHRLKPLNLSSCNPVKKYNVRKFALPTTKDFAPGIQRQFSDRAISVGF
jgi:hypothetical protein